MTTEQQSLNLNSVEVIWEALVEVDQFLHYELVELLSEAVSVYPNDWTKITHAVEVLEKERLSVPKAIHWQATEAIEYSLVPNVNALMELLNNLISTRTSKDESGERQSIIKINMQIQKLKGEFRLKLRNLKAEIDRLMPSANLTNVPERKLNLPSLETVGGDFIVDGVKESNKEINIDSGATISAPVLIADTVENSLNTVLQSKANDEIKELLNQLIANTALIGKQIPADDAESLSRDVETLTKEVTSSHPRRNAYEGVSKRIKDTVKQFAELGKPMLDIMSMLIPLLIKQFP